MQEVVFANNYFTALLTKFYGLYALKVHIFLTKPSTGFP